MATSKTLTPTNVTIQIPAFTDQPDQRVNSNCIDKEADAINALNSKILEKTSFVDLGNKTGMKKAWDALTIYDKAVIGQYNNGGVRAFFAYKYTGSQYGFMLQIRWGSNNIDMMTVTDNVETIKTIYAS